jgi:hypothetical protein
VFDVVDRLVEALWHVVVVKAVDGTAAVAPPGGQAQGAQQPQFCG